MSSYPPEVTPDGNAPLFAAANGQKTSSPSSQLALADPGGKGVAAPSTVGYRTKWTPRLPQRPIADPQDTPPNRRGVFAPRVFEEPQGNLHDNERNASCAFEQDETAKPLGVAGWARNNSADQSDTSFVLTQCPALESGGLTCSQGFAKRSLDYPRRACESLSETADRILVLLWRVFTLKARHPIMTLIGTLAPGEPMVVDRSCWAKNCRTFHLYRCSRIVSLYCFFYRFWELGFLHCSRSLCLKVFPPLCSSGAFSRSGRGSLHNSCSLPRH